MFFERPFEARNFGSPYRAIAERFTKHGSCYFWGGGGGAWLTRMPSQTFNLGHEAARESDQRFSVLRNCGKDRRQQRAEKKQRKKETCWKMSGIRVPPFFFYDLSHDFVQIDTFQIVGRNYKERSLLQPNYKTIVPFNYPGIDTKYHSAVSIWSLSRPFKLRRNPYRIVEMIHSRLTLQPSQVNAPKWKPAAGSPHTLHCWFICNRKNITFFWSCPVLFEQDVLVVFTSIDITKLCPSR